MMAARRLTRRGLLRSVALAWLALALPWPRPAAWRRAVPGPWLLRASDRAFVRRCVATLESRGSARWLGRHYLRTRAGRADAPGLARCLARDLGPAAQRLDRAALRDALAARQREDFARGELVRLDGWILSRTEARLYALAALI